MTLSSQYILKYFNRTFFSIFSILFTITTISIMVKTALISASIGLNGIEFAKIYSYLMPTNLFYILPIVFFMSASMSLSQISLDSECIAMFSCGMSMKKLYMVYLPYASYFSIMLLTISLGILPITKHASTTFIEEKTLTKGIDFSNSSEFGQKFGQWFIFVNKDNNNTLSNVVLFKSDINNEDFIISKNAKFDDRANLKLSDGKAFLIKKDNILEINYKKMFVYNPFNSIHNYFSSVKEYWLAIHIDKKRLAKFVTAILFSIFPFISIHAIIAIGLLKPRISKKTASWYSFFMLLAYVILAKSLSVFGWVALFTIPIVWFSFCYMLFYFRLHNIID